ncbi:MAG: hypothetical protein D6826_10630, partial [Alphaproteobacteria bacterium]
ALFGTGQQAVQRFLSCADLRAARRAALTGWAVGTLALGVTLLLGTWLSVWPHAGKLDPKTPIDTAALRAAGLVNNPRDGVRLLAKGTLKAKITISVVGASKAAIAAVEQAGGHVDVTAPATAATSQAEAPASA